jgi:hypothetical protein
MIYTKIDLPVAMNQAMRHKGGGREEVVRDEIRYSDHRINRVLPVEVSQFQLPEDVPVEDLKW